MRVPSATVSSVEEFDAVPLHEGSSGLLKRRILWRYADGMVVLKGVSDYAVRDDLYRQVLPRFVDGGAMARDCVALVEKRYVVARGTATLTLVRIAIAGIAMDNRMYRTLKRIESASKREEWSFIGEIFSDAAGVAETSASGDVKQRLDAASLAAGYMAKDDARAAMLFLADAAGMTVAQWKEETFCVWC